MLKSFNPVAGGAVRGNLEIIVKENTLLRLLDFCSRKQEISKNHLIKMAR